MVPGRECSARCVGLSKAVRRMKGGRTEQLKHSLTVKYWSPTTKLAIIRTHRAAEPTIRGALFFVRSIKDTDCAVRVLHVGGEESTKDQHMNQSPLSLFLTPPSSVWSLNRIHPQDSEGSHSF